MVICRSSHVRTVEGVNLQVFQFYRFSWTTKTKTLPILASTPPTPTPRIPTITHKKETKLNEITLWLHTYLCSPFIFTAPFFSEEKIKKLGHQVQLHTRSPTRPLESVCPERKCTSLLGNSFCYKHDDTFTSSGNATYFVTGSRRQTFLLLVCLFMKRHIYIYIYIRRTYIY